MNKLKEWYLDNKNEIDCTIGGTIFMGIFMYLLFVGTVRKETVMKGYITQNGYMGLVGNIYILFTTEQEYKEYMEE